MAAITLCDYFYDCRADSMTWNPHKLMGVLLQCSAVLLREKGWLEACNSLKADYLFQQDKHYDINYDTGDKAIQCGRHNDIFKLWLLWRAKVCVLGYPESYYIREWFPC